MLKVALGEQQEPGFSDPVAVDTPSMVVGLKKYYSTKWGQISYKLRHISRHMPFTEYSASVSVPPNSQSVKVACLNIFNENLKYIESSVPQNSFQTKRDLMHVILNDNTELLENLISDEQFFGDQENPQKMGWFEGVSTINIIQNRLGNMSGLAQDIDMAVKLDVVAEDVQNSFARFRLSQVFEIHRLDLFHGNFRTFCFNPLDDLYPRLA